MAINLLTVLFVVWKFSNTEQIKLSFEEDHSFRCIGIISERCYIVIVL